MAGDIFELYIGPDELTGTKQYVRVQILDCTTVGEHGRVRVNARFKAIGGGKTNVPRWQSWPILVFDMTVVDAMRKTGQLEPCVSDMVGAAR